MTKKLEVTEYIPAVWNRLFIVSIAIILLFSGLWILSNSPLWIGIFRLSAFIGFALLVISFLQKRGKTSKIILEMQAEKLVINYFLTSKKNQEEFFELPAIKQIKRIPAPPAWNILPRNDAVKFIISFTDTPATLSLFRFQGHSLFVSAGDAQKMDLFLTNNLPAVVEQ